VLTEARLTFSRQQELLKNGWTPRANFGEAQQKLLTAEAQVDCAQAQARIVGIHSRSSSVSASISFQLSRLSVIMAKMGAHGMNE
jgi:hypothetical protein